MDRLAPDVSEEWEHQWYDTEGVVGTNAHDFQDQDDHSGSRPNAGYSLNNPVLARIDYRYRSLLGLQSCKPQSIVVITIFYFPNSEKNLIFQGAASPIQQARTMEYICGKCLWHCNYCC